MRGHGVGEVAAVVQHPHHTEDRESFSDHVVPVVDEEVGIQDVNVLKHPSDTVVVAIVKSAVTSSLFWP